MCMLFSFNWTFDVLVGVAQIIITRFDCDSLSIDADKGMDVFMPLLLPTQGAQRSTDFDCPFHFCIFYTEQ